MAMAFEGFSIREYASKMRTVDVVKCWPFGRNSDENRKEEVEASLPPITVRKFRWWSDELELVRSDGERPKICGETSKASCSEAAFPSDVEAEKMGVGQVAIKLPKTALGPQPQKVDFVPSVSRDFTASTANAVNLHADGCLSKEEEQRQLKMRGKWKTPKKRSIVEIFAVAPQVERVDDGDDDGDEEENSSEEQEFVQNSKVLALFDVFSNVKGKEKLMDKKKPKLKQESMDKLKKQKRMNKTKGPKMERDFQSVQYISKKEKPHKNKLQSPIKFTTKPNSLLDDKVLGKKNLDAVSVRKLKQRVKGLATEKDKFRHTSVLIKHQKSKFPVRGILKNHNNGTSGGGATVCNSQIPSEVNQCGIVQADRHVKFSDTDVILGPRRKPFSLADSPKLQHICSLNSKAIPGSSVKDHGIGRGKEVVIVEVNGGDEDVSTSSENDTDHESAGKMQSPDNLRHDIPKFLRPHMGIQQHLLDRSVSADLVENSEAFEHGCRDTSHDPQYDCYPRFLSQLKEGYNPSVSQVGADVSTTNSSNILVESLSRTTSGVPAVCSMEYVKEFPQPSSSYFSVNANPNGRIPFPAQNIPANYNNHPFPYQPYRHLSPKELMCSICSIPDWKQRAVMGKETCLGDDFCGLPLNSHGEIIQLDSNGKGVFNQLMRPTSTVTGSARSSAQHNMLPHSILDLSNFNDKIGDGGIQTKDRLNMFPVFNFVKENPNLPVSSRLGISRLQGTERTGGHRLDLVGEYNPSAYSLGGSDLELMNISHQGHGQHNQFQSQRGNGKGHQLGKPDSAPVQPNQPTMRLMGIEFKIGRSSAELQTSEDGKVWTDKQIIAEHRPARTGIDSSSLERQFQQDLTVFPASEKLKENVACSSETQVNQASQRALQNQIMKPPGSSFSHPYLNCTTDAGYSSYYPSINGSHIPQMHPYLPRASSPPLLSRTPTFQEPSTCGYEWLQVNPQMPKSASSHHGYTSLNSAELQNKQKLPHATKQGFEFPFLHPDYEERVETSCFQSSNKSLPLWLLSATQQKKTSPGFFQSYSEMGGRHHSSTISGTTLRTIPSIMQNPISSPNNPAPEVSYPYNPAFPCFTMQNSFCPASFARPPLLPLYRECVPTSAINDMRGDRMKFKGRMSSRVGFKKPVQGTKTRKRPAPKSDDSAKRTKIPNLTVQEDSSAETALKASMAALELDSITGKAGGIGQIETLTNHGLGVSPAVDTFKMDGFVRTGPIKLSAGAKHVLKPGSDVSQDYFRPTYSTIPIGEANSSGWVSESEKKSAQIYRF